MHHEIIRASEDGLRSDLWRFYVDFSRTPFEIRLTTWVESTRKTKRHSWKEKKSFVSYQNYGKPDSIKIPEDVIAELRATLIAAVSTAPVKI